MILFRKRKTFQSLYSMKSYARILFFRSSLTEPRPPRLKIHLSWSFRFQLKRTEWLLKLSIDWISAVFFCKPQPAAY